MKASIKNYRQSPRKVRLVADAVRGKRVADAVTYLTFLPKRAALPLKKLIDSAVANAVKMGEDATTLTIADIRVDKGIVLKRMMPRARGSAFRINKRTSHVSIALGSKAIKAPVKKVSAKKVKATA